MVARDSVAAIGGDGDLMDHQIMTDQDPTSKNNISDSRQAFDQFADAEESIDIKINNSDSQNYLNQRQQDFDQFADAEESVVPENTVTESEPKFSLIELPVTQTIPATAENTNTNPDLADNTVTESELEFFGAVDPDLLNPFRVLNSTPTEETSPTPSLHGQPRQPRHPDIAEIFWHKSSPVRNTPAPPDIAPTAPKSDTMFEPRFEHHYLQPAEARVALEAKTDLLVKHITALQKEEDPEIHALLKDNLFIVRADLLIFLDRVEKEELLQGTALFWEPQKLSEDFQAIRDVATSAFDNIPTVATFPSHTPIGLTEGMLPNEIDDDSVESITPRQGDNNFSHSDDRPSFYATLENPSTPHLVADNLLDDSTTQRFGLLLDQALFDETKFHTVPINPPTPAPPLPQHPSKYNSKSPRRAKYRARSRFVHHVDATDTMEPSHNPISVSLFLAFMSILLLATTFETWLPSLLTAISTIPSIANTVWTHLHSMWYYSHYLPAVITWVLGWLYTTLLAPCFEEKARTAPAPPMSQARAKQHDRWTKRNRPTYDPIHLGLRHNDHRFCPTQHRSALHPRAIVFYRIQRHFEQAILSCLCTCGHRYRAFTHSFLNREGDLTRVYAPKGGNCAENTKTATNGHCGHHPHCHPHTRDNCAGRSGNPHHSHPKWTKNGERGVDWVPSTAKLNKRYRPKELNQKPAKHLKKEELVVLISQLHRSKALKQALQHPQKFRSEMPDDGVFQIVWDSGASISITFDQRDFQGTLEPFRSQLKLKGVSQGIKIEGQGLVTWNVMDTAGTIQSIKVPVLYVPNSHIRLLSTQNLLQTYTGEEIKLTQHDLTLSRVDGDTQRRPVHVNVNKTNNLPTSLAYAIGGIKVAVAAFNSEQCPSCQHQSHGT